MGLKYKGKIENDYDVVNKKYADRKKTQAELLAITTGTNGDWYFCTDDNKFYVYDSTVTSATVGHFKLASGDVKAEAISPTWVKQAYSKGADVMKDGLRYIANTDIPADEDWDSTHWDLVSVTKTISTKQDIMQYETMPTASEDNVDKILQYIGASTTDYETGFFYQCVLDSTTSAYQWKNVVVQPTEAVKTDGTTIHFNGSSELEVVDGGINVDKLADDSVETAKIKDANVTTDKVVDSAITTDKIADANVTTDKIADDAVTTSKILDANVTTNKLADASVTTDKIADDNVTTDKVADKAITNAKLEDGSATTGVTTDKINTDTLRKEIRAQGVASDANLVTEKAVIDKIIEMMTSIFQIKGNKSTIAEIQALTGSTDMEAWICEEDSSIYYWKNSVWNVVTLVNLSSYLKVSDIVNDLTTGGTEKTLSAEQGKTLQDNKLNKNEDDTLKGHIFCDTYAGIVLINSNSYGEISFWGSPNGDGSMLRMFGKDAQGGWILQANNGTVSSQVTGSVTGLQVITPRVSEKSIDEVVALADVDGSTKFIPLIMFTSSDAPEGNNTDTYAVTINKYNSTFYELTAYNFSTGKTWVYTNVWGTKSGWKELITSASVQSSTVVLDNEEHSDYTKIMLLSSLSAHSETHYGGIYFSANEGPDNDTETEWFVEAKKLTDSTGYLVAYCYNLNIVYRTYFNGSTWTSWKSI